MKTKLSVLIVSFFLLFSVASAKTFVVPHVLEVSAGLTPNSAFYFFDGIGEWVSLKLTFNPVKKAEKKLQYASERLAELRKVAQTGDVTREKTEKITNSYEKFSQDAVDDADELRGEGKDVAELVRKIEAIAVQHTAVLKEVIDKAPEQAKEALEHALEVSQRGHERVIEAIEKEIEEGDIEIEELEEDLKEEIEERKREHEEELEKEKEMRPGAKIQELDLEDEEDEIEGLTKEVGEDELKDLNGDIDTIEKSTK